MSTLRKNPFVPKAQSAEQKAADTTDNATRTRSYRDAAHQWDRAAEREAPGKARTEYEQRAALNRRRAEGEEVEDDDAGEVSPPGGGERLLH